MMLHSRFIPWLGLALALAAAPADAAKGGSPWERSVVTIEITRKQYDYIQPWSRRMESYQKSGLVVGAKQILTTAEYLSDHTLVRLQKNGRGIWVNGEVRWIDYHANLALITTSDTAFWNGLSVVKLADPVPTQGRVQILRWRSGKLEGRSGDINRVTAKRGKLSFSEEHLHLEVDTEIKGAGWGEPVVMGNKVLGITSSQDGSSCSIIPSPFLRFILTAAQNGKGEYRGLGYFDFTWTRAENPTTLKYLNLPGPPRGVIITEVEKVPGKTSLLKPRDLILKVDGFEIDIEGDYNDPLYGNLSLENLATRNKWAGDTVRLTIWRDGKQMELDYQLPKSDYAAKLVPQAIFDQEPEYYLIGGLLFQPLSEPYLRSWGPDWRRAVPFRLSYQTHRGRTPERSSLIILSQVLPDPYNLGYNDHRYLAVDKVNGQNIGKLTDLADALKKPINGFHVIEFQKGDSLRRIVLDAEEAEAATRRILERFGIEKQFVFATPPPPAERAVSVASGQEKSN